MGGNQVAGKKLVGTTQAVPLGAAAMVPAKASLSLNRFRLIVCGSSRLLRRGAQRKREPAAKRKAE